MKKRIFALFLGLAIGAGGLFAVPMTTRAEGAAAEETADDSTASHFDSCAGTVGDGQITVTYDARGLSSGGEGTSGEIWFFLSDKADATEEDLLSNFPYGVPYAGPLYARGSSYTFTGLTNGKTYYLYVQVWDAHGAEEGGLHDLWCVGAYTPDASADVSSGSAGSGAARESDYDTYLDNVNEQIKTAEAGSTIVMEKGIMTIDNNMMKELLAKKDVSLKLEYTYQGVDYVVIIPAGEAVDNDIPLYGPLYLSAHYGNSVGAEGIPAGGADYTVQPGDSMYKIAQANGMSLAELSARNPQIKDINKIKVGQKINL